MIRKARSENDYVYVSIFVNPTQFGPNDDYHQYPRTIEHDIQICHNEYVDHIFIPNDSNILYPKNSITSITIKDIDLLWDEGKVRPKHFDGVLTIVNKLCNIIQPTILYLGQKDIRQCYTIRHMIYDLFIPTKVSIVPTYREIDGLAMSSRNIYLNDKQRIASTILYKALINAQNYYIDQQNDMNDNMIKLSLENNIKVAERIKDEIQQLKCISGIKIKSIIMETLQTEPLVAEIQYIAIDDRKYMMSLEHIQLNHHHPKNKQNNDYEEDDEEYGAIISIAVKIGTVRLIDNIILK